MSAFDTNMSNSYMELLKFTIVFVLYICIFVLQNGGNAAQNELNYVDVPS